jgi:hypothetical protein
MIHLWECLTRLSVCTRFFFFTAPLGHLQLVELFPVGAVYRYCATNGIIRDEVEGSWHYSPFSLVGVFANMPLCPFAAAKMIPKWAKITHAEVERSWNGMINILKQCIESIALAPQDAATLPQVGRSEALMNYILQRYEMSSQQLGSATHALLQNMLSPPEPIRVSSVTVRLLKAVASSVLLDRQSSLTCIHTCVHNGHVLFLRQQVNGFLRYLNARTAPNNWNITAALTKELKTKKRPASPIDIDAAHSSPAKRSRTTEASLPLASAPGPASGRLSAQGTPDPSPHKDVASSDGKARRKTPARQAKKTQEVTTAPLSVSIPRDLAESVPKHFIDANVLLEKVRVSWIFSSLTVQPKKQHLIIVHSCADYGTG